MNYKEWSVDFEVGIGAIDQDHQTLFNAIRQLGEKINAGRGAGRIKATINSLLLYVDEHFEREERFMLRAGYPGYDSHKIEHDRFRDSIFSLRDFHEMNPEGVDAQKIVSFLEEWLLNHILKIDVLYAPYLIGEKQGDPKILEKGQEEKHIENIQIACPADKEEHVKDFISLISHRTEEGVLVEAAVEKITQVQKTRREKKAKLLFGR